MDVTDLRDIDDNTDYNIDDTTDDKTDYNACVMWDFRISADGLEQSIVANQLKKIAKKWTFQLEKGEQNGYLHYQGRFSLIKKKRSKFEIFKLLTLHNPYNYCEKTVNVNYYKGDMFYVLKDETRVDGPWDERTKEKYIPRQFRDLEKKLYPYQRTIWESASNFDSRTINLIYCAEGNKGKSTIAALCQLHMNSIYLPPVNDAEKLVSTCCDICEAKELRNPPIVFVDLPRAMNKDKLFGIYSAIEQIKNGYLYDFRYKYKEYWIDSPQVWVFTNCLPDLSMLSQDRWKIWQIDNLNLIPFQIINNF